MHPIPLILFPYVSTGNLFQVHSICGYIIKAFSYFSITYNSDDERSQIILKKTFTSGYPAYLTSEGIQI